MSEFRLQKPKVIEVKDADGNLLREFTLDVGNYDMMKRWQSKIGEIEEMQKRVQEGDQAVDDLVALEKELVGMTTGGWEFLWEQTGQNVFSMMAFISHVSSFIKEEVDKRTKAYL